MVESNKEHGEGRSDVVVYDPEEGRVAVLRLSIQNAGNYGYRLSKALDQINEKCMQKNLKMILITFCAMVFPFKKRCCIKLKDAKV